MIYTSRDPVEHLLHVGQRVHHVKSGRVHVVAGGREKVWARWSTSLRIEALPACVLECAEGMMSITMVTRISMSCHKIVFLEKMLYQD